MDDGGGEGVMAMVVMVVVVMVVVMVVMVVAVTVVVAQPLPGNIQIRARSLRYSAQCCWLNVSPSPSPDATV